jgi:lipid-binding SYLF domain-containing protein
MLFSVDYPSAKELMERAVGTLIFPEVIQGGIGIGGAYGEGVLRVDGKSVGYYSYTNGSVGFQLGAQRKSMLFLFLDPGALKDFQAKAQNSGQWQVGVDGSLTLIKSVGDLYANTAMNAPIVGYVFEASGLMFNASVGGGKVASIHRGATAEPVPPVQPAVAPITTPVPSRDCGFGNPRVGPYCTDEEDHR